MADLIHYAEPNLLIFKSIVVYNKDGLIMVELHDGSGAVVHSFHTTGSFDASSKLRLSMGGRVTVMREL